MQNHNYNILKLLHNKLDDVWRMEKHCLADSDDAEYQKLLQDILAADQKNIVALQKYMASRYKADDFK